MPLRSLLRLSPIVWLSPFLLLLASVYPRVLSAVTSDPYPLAYAAVGAFSVVFVAPVCAACAAWEGGRLRRAEWFDRPHSRSPLVVALSLTYPIMILGVMILTVATMVTLLGTGLFVLPALHILLPKLAIIFVHVLLGFAVGVRLPTVIAVPGVLLIDYVWMTVPDALHPLWLRHLTGAWGSCCMVGSELAPQAILGTLIVVLGMAGTAILLLQQDRRLRQVWLAGVPLVLALVVGSVVVRDLGADPVVPRSPQLLVCSATEPRVCVWPEHRTRLDEVSALAVAASTRWRDAGVAVPSEFSEWHSLGILERGFGFSMASSMADLRVSLANSVLPSWPDCVLSGPYLAGPAEIDVLAWLVATSGASAEELNLRFGPETAQNIAVLQGLPLDEQQAWYQANVAAMSVCDQPPHPIPYP